MIGQRLVPLLVASHHDVAGMTRRAAKVGDLRRQGAVPVLCDVYDPIALGEAVADFAPDLVMHQLTDLPDDADQIPAFAARNRRMRTEGTRNLLAAARGAGAPRFLAQSIAWLPPGQGDAVALHERLVLDAGGVVVRYGAFYGPGTFSPSTVPPPPRVHVDEAARRTLDALDALDVPGGVIVIAE